MFGLQDIYEGDDVRIQEGENQADSSGSVEVKVKDWQNQVDGVSDKWRTGVKITVRFGGARRVSMENNEEHKVDEAVAKFSLSVQVPAGDVGAMRGDGWREQS